MRLTGIDSVGLGIVVYWRRAPPDPVCRCRAARGARCDERVFRCLGAE